MSPIFTSVPKRVRGPVALEAIALRRQYPCLTLQRIADELGYSREYVRQILAKAGMPTRHYDGRHCPVCDKALHRLQQETCSRACYHRYHWVLVACDYCGMLFERRLSQIIAHGKNRKYKDGMYCGRPCYAMMQKDRPRGW